MRAELSSRKAPTRWVTASNLPDRLYNDIVGMDTSTVFAGEIVIGQLICFGLQVTHWAFPSTFSYTNSLICILFTPPIQLYNLFGRGLRSPFECLCRNFHSTELRRPCLFFYLFLFCATYSTLFGKEREENGGMEKTRGPG